MVMASPVHIYINKQVFLFVTLSVHFWAHPSLNCVAHDAPPLPPQCTVFPTILFSFFLSHFYTVNALFCIIFPCSVSVSVRIFHFSPLLFWWSGVLTRGRLDLCQLPSHYRHRINHDAGFCVSLCPNSNLVLGFWCPLPDNYYCIWPIHAKTNIQVAWVLLYMIGTTLSSMKFSK